MKYLYPILFGFILLITLNLNAQEENVIVDTNKVWSILEENCHPWGNTYTTFFMRFRGDTAVDGHTYKKVQVSYTEDQSEWIAYGGMIRENDSMQVFYRNYSGEEGMIYDFAIEEGDTVEIVNPRLMMEPIPLYVSNIDSIESNTGLLKRFTLEGTDYLGQDIWYEEIGSIASVLNSTYPLFGQSCGAWEFLCLKEDNELIYSNPEYQTCYYELVGLEERPADLTYEISPNPAGNFIRITTTANINASKLLIYDLTGKTVKVVRSPLEKTFISLSGLAPGIYLVGIVTTEGKQINKKLIIR